MPQPACKLLIVDDSPEDRTFVRHVLEEVPLRQWVFVEEGKGALALKRLEGQSFDCILLDYQLPEMNGVRFLQELGARFGPLRFPVVMFTGSGRADIAVEALKAGAQDYISKDNIRDSTLVRAIDGAIDRVRLLREREAQRTELENVNSRLRLLEAAVQASSESVLITDSELVGTGPRVVFANQAFSAMTGYALEEVIGGTATLLDGPRTGRRVLDILRHNIAEGRRSAGETVNYRKDGSEFIMDWAIAPIVNDKGCPTNYVAIQRDVTERHRAGQRLAESRQRMELALWGADLGLWDYEPNTGRATYDQRWAAMLGYKVEEIEPAFDAWASLVHPEDFPSMKYSLDRHLNGESPVFEAEFRMRSSTGEWRWILSRGKVVERLPDGTPVRATGTHLDVTARREAEIALRHSNEDLQQFAYAVSHDLQEPLRMMTAYSGLLRDHTAGKLDSDGEIFLTTIQDGARRASRLVTDLLKYASAGADERDSLIESCDLDEALDAAIVLLEHRIEETGAVIQRDPLPIIDANCSQIEQLFYNLLHNALKYSRPHEPPRIRIASQKQDGQWIVAVHDNGTGFDPAKAEYIFGVFKRLHAADYSGTGIGLALCKRIVDRHGGRIWAESEPGVGSVFSFKLPARVHAAAIGGHRDE